MGYGDEIVAAGQAQRLHERDGRRVSIVGVDHRPRWHPIWNGNPILVRPDEHVNGGHVTSLMSGPACRPYIVYPFTKESGWTFNKGFRCRDHVAKLYLTLAELEMGHQLREDVGPYVLIEPFTKHDNFRWPLEQWAALVKACPDLTFVQHTHAQSTHIPGVRYQAASFREACGLIASAELYVRSESGLCHAAAALETPQVTIFGGCMDPDVMGFYPGQYVIADHGDGSPCGRWLPCGHCADVMGRLSVDEVIAALRARLHGRAA